MKTATLNKEISMAKKKNHTMLSLFHVQGPVHAWHLKKTVFHTCFYLPKDVMQDPNVTIAPPKVMTQEEFDNFIEGADFATCYDGDVELIRNAKKVAVQMRRWATEPEFAICKIWYGEAK